MALLFSIGHSNRTLDDFLALLDGHSIAALADVRAFPASRRWPQFNRELLAKTLADRGIAYVWLPELGGRRKRIRPDSPHTAWKVESFRNYADHLASAEFALGVQRLVASASKQRTAFMCAEALYWQCHRRLIADYLSVNGHAVEHIQSPTRSEPHRLPPFARLVDGRLLYDGGTQLQML